MSPERLSALAAGEPVPTEPTASERIAAGFASAPDVAVCQVTIRLLVASQPGVMILLIKPTSILSAWSCSRC